ncbi:MAG: hypothetical protein V1891_03605 [bacterium]
MIKNLRFNRNRNNTNGIFSVEDQKFFYKILCLDDYEKELNGYRIIKEEYPVANLIFNGYINNKKNGLLIFEYEKTIEKNHGLLVDVFSNSKSYQADEDIFDRILKVYKKAFQNSFKKTSSKTSDVFFKDRIETRLKKYYKQSFFEETGKLNFVFKKWEIKNIQFKKIISFLEKFLLNKKPEYCVLSQCDPNDLNIGIKPIVLDYLGGGYNPLMAEFAIIFWYCVAQGNYFSVIYNKKEYADHPNIIKKIDRVNFRKRKLDHSPSRKRIAFLINCIERVIDPLINKMPDNYDWYGDFKNYLAMRIISVFNISTMKEKDKNLSLAYLDIFYNQLSISKTSQLIEAVKKI